MEFGSEPHPVSGLGLCLLSPLAQIRAQEDGSFKRSVKIQINIHKLNSMAVERWTNASCLCFSSSSPLSPCVTIEDKDLCALGNMAFSSME